VLVPTVCAVDGSYVAIHRLAQSISVDLALFRSLVSVGFTLKGNGENNLCIV
jgi:hypothetical protein